MQIVNFNGKVISHSSDVIKGSKGTDYKKRTLIVESEGEYSKKLALETLNEEIFGEIDDLGSGEPVTIGFVPESREYNDRWFTHLKLISVKSLMDKPKNMPVEEADDDLPF